MVNSMSLVPATIAREQHRDKHDRRGSTTSARATHHRKSRPLSIFPESKLGSGRFCWQRARYLERYPKLANFKTQNYATRFSAFPLSLTSMDSPVKITLAHLQHLRNPPWGHSVKIRRCQEHRSRKNTITGNYLNH